MSLDTTVPAPSAVAPGGGSTRARWSSTPSPCGSAGSSPSTRSASPWRPDPSTAQTASAVGQAAAQGLTVPMFGSNPTDTPQLLATPAAAALTSGQFITAASIQPFNSTAPVVKDLATK